MQTRKVGARENGPLRGGEQLAPGGPGSHRHGVMMPRRGPGSARTGPFGDGGETMPSFDVVSQVDLQEVRNAVDQASREVGTRFDFKDTATKITLGADDLTVESSTEDRLKAANEVLKEKLVRR